MSSLLNKSAVKKFILAKIASLRPGMEKQLTSVSSEALNKLEIRLKNWIESDIMHHPSKGKRYNP
jgi:hypothetical protein